MRMFAPRRLFRSTPGGGEGGRHRSGWRWSTAAAVGIIGLAAAYFLLPPPKLERSQQLSALVLARDGTILRGFLSRDGKWRMPIAAAEVDPLYRQMLIAAEDRRFENHPGVDPLAVLRAAGQWLAHGHPVSGASTLTMQT